MGNKATSTTAAALLTGALLMNAPVQATEEISIGGERFDPAVTSLVQSFSDQLQDATGKSMAEDDKNRLSKSMTESFNNNIREGFCRTVTYRITREDRRLIAEGNVCRINNEFVFGP